MIYAKDNRKGGDKFDVRGRRCIFVGYPYSQKGYHVYDLETREIYTSRDVRFIENIFPYKTPDHESGFKRIKNLRQDE